MTNIATLLTEHIDIWTAVDTEKRTGRGRASGNVGSVYGVKKLRELILELAIRGKLVPQDPNDEPASELIKHIQEEKSKLITEGKLKKEKPLAPISEDEKPFELPSGWEWVHLPDVTDYKVGKTPSTKSSIYWTNDSNGYNWVSIADLNHYGVVTETSKRVTREALKDVFKAEPVAVGTILMSFKLTLGKISILEVPAFHNEAIISIYPSPAIDKKYLFKILPARANEGDSKSAIKGNTLNSESIAALLLPLPPLAEQHRIVAKVDELMALCDQLEQQHSNAQEAHETLVSQLLATLTQSQNAAEFNANWQRIYAHFDVLFTTEASIDTLKQTLLQLAVMGKLVPQDPNEEPASELLKRIQVEKAKLIAEGKLKKEKPLATISEDEKPFELPKGWEWVRFPELGEFARGKSKHRPRNDPSLFNPPIYPLVQTGEVARAGYIIQEYHSKYSETGLLQSRMWEQGTLCITIAANIADSAILGFDACFPDSVVGFSPSKLIKSAKYFLYFMKTAREDLLKFAPATAQKNINLEILESVLIPTPPLSEQHRIVDKVDALMALCDQLQTLMQQANQQQQTIAEALVSQAVT